MKYYPSLKITVEITNNVHGSQIYYTTQKNLYLMAIYDPRNMIDQLDIISILEGPNRNV